MFPGVDGFHWSFGHILFLTLFGLVLTTVAVTTLTALWRTRRDVRTGRAGHLMWETDFEDLPEHERRCRHAMTGIAPGRTCHNGFDCGGCQQHARFAALESSADSGERFGLNYPAGRLYDRGHTWVEVGGNGEITIGLDDLATRLAGRVDRVDLPAPGTRLTARGPAWTMRRGKDVMRLRSPIDGVVTATGGPEDGWYLKVKAEPSADLRHLLSGAEVSSWLRCELERLQILLAPAATGPSLADGGMLEDDLPEAAPKADWAAVYPAMFLEP